MKHRVFLLSLLLAGSLTLPVSAAVLTAANAEDTQNSAPIAENLTLNTYQEVAIASRFAAVDPEGDLVTFQVVDSPARGQVTVDENDTAAFWYTPYENKKGNDTFTYVAVDSAGNTSEPATVKITISVPTSGVVYSDMDGHEAHYAALRLAEEGLYTGRQMGELYCFDPEETFTREEFLALAMSVTDCQPLEDVSLTGFYDDGSIPSWAKGYVSAALLSGAVQGCYNEQGQIVFNSGAAITQAEAAVMLDRLLEVSDVSGQSTMADQSVPTWASQSVANLETLSVLTGATQLSDPLTRGEAAQMLCAALDVVDSRDSGWFW